MLLLYISGQELVGILNNNIERDLALGGFGAAKDLNLIEVDDFFDDRLSG